jgi:hypothetical protein
VAQAKLNHQFGGVKGINSHKYMHSNFKPPPAIIFINGDITYPPTTPVFIGSDPSNPTSYAGFSELTNLQTQLFIDDTMHIDEFVARVVGDPNYPTIVHLQDLRILVILHKHRAFCQQDGYFAFADVVMFLHQGLADIEINRFGPPGQNYDLQRINIYAVLRAREHCHNDIEVPFQFCGGGCDNCHSGFFCDICHTFSGIRKCYGCGCWCKCKCDVGLIDQRGVRSSPVHLPNCDNERNNPAFVHRK